MPAKTFSPSQRISAALAIGLGLFALALLAVIIGFHFSYAGRIYPGVRVGWADLSGLTPTDAAALLSREYDYPQRGRILLRDGNRTWVASPAEAGLFLGAEHNAQAAYMLGRSGPLGRRLSTQFRAWYTGVNLPVEMLFDERIAEYYLEGLAAQVDIPTVEASLSVDGVDVVVNPGQVGRDVDVAATLDLLAAQVQTILDGEIPLVVDESPPVILDVSAQAEIARQILSAPLVLTFPGAAAGDPGPWTFPPQDLAGMLSIERVPTPEGAVYQVGISPQVLRSFFEGIAPSLWGQAENARFMFNDDTHELELIQPAVIGQSLDVEATLQAIKEKVPAGEHTLALDMEYTLPKVSDDATAASLGITELVSSHTSYFYGSDTSRKQNIQTAASRFYGVLVAPGEVFSMAGVLGNVSLDMGYAEAWIIYGDRTIKGVGGGVCQVSTTLFRTAFFGGFPVVERHPHAYRVYYYEQTSGGGHDPTWAGLDATVYVPLVDLKFTNYTEYWLLMETYVAANSLTWKFYSTSDGRSVEWETSGLTNKQDPPDPLYQENSDLSKGEIKQVDWAVEGADVTVTRYVWRSGEIIFDDIFKTHYMPWRAVCEYGPGTKGMPPEEPDPDNPCKPDQ
ncbi:MAG: VanW family protein [Chloroflexota bacterium]